MLTGDTATAAEHEDDVLVTPRKPNRATRRALARWQPIATPQPLDTAAARARRARRRRVRDARKAARANAR